VTERVRAHFESLLSRPVFHISARELAAAKRRHPETAARVTISRGEDLAGFPRRLRNVDVLIAAEFVLSHPKFPLRDLARAAPRLRVIHVTNAGIERLLPLDWLPQSVKLTNSSGAHFAKACEFAAMSIIALNARLPEMIGNQAQRRWIKVLSGGVAGKTLCVVGVGAVGRAFAQEGKRMGMTVLGVRRSGKSAPYVDRMYPVADLKTALGKADFVAVSAPLTPETRFLIGAPEFRAMRDGAGFINVGRGRVVDTKALQAGLRSGRISGAIVDVFDPEPPPSDSDLWATPNLFMTPHVGLDDAEHFLGNCLDIGFDNLARYLAGKRLKNPVNGTTGY